MGENRMQFYKFTHPQYETDQDADKANPIRVSTGLQMPGMICSSCGEIWAGSRRLYLAVTDLALRRRLGVVAPLPEREWMQLAQDVRQVLSLPEDFEFQPGDELGTPIAELKTNNIPDFLHPFPGQIIVQSRVVDVIMGENLTGVRLLPLQVRWGDGKQVRSNPPPILFELVITGTGWRVDSNLENITACTHCGRTIFLKWSPIDEARWDSSDFFHVDRNPNIVIVTERVCALFAQHHFTNFLCVPLP